MPCGSSRWMTEQSRALPPDAPGYIEGFPALSFHYGFSFEELVRMPRWVRDLYLEKLDELLALEQAHSLDAAAYPDMKDDARERYRKRIERRAKVNERVEAVKTKADLEKAM